MPALSPEIPFNSASIKTIFPTFESRWEALMTKDARAATAFLYCVKSTKIYCRPICTARLARKKNVIFYDTVDEAEKAGFRPCKRCKPRLPLHETHHAMIRTSCRTLDNSPSVLPPLKDLAKEVGLTQWHFHRLFRRFTGITPRMYWEARHFPDKQTRHHVDFNEIAQRLNGYSSQDPVNNRGNVPERRQSDPIEPLMSSNNSASSSSANQSVLPSNSPLSVSSNINTPSSENDSNFGSSSIGVVNSNSNSSGVVNASMGAYIGTEADTNNSHSYATSSSTGNNNNNNGFDNEDSLNNQYWDYSSSSPYPLSTTSVTSPSTTGIGHNTATINNNNNNNNNNNTQANINNFKRTSQIHSNRHMDFDHLISSGSANHSRVNSLTNNGIKSHSLQGSPLVIGLGEDDSSSLLSQSTGSSPELEFPNKLHSLSVPPSAELHAFSPLVGPTSGNSGILMNLTLDNKNNTNNNNIHGLARGGNNNSSGVMNSDGSSPSYSHFSFQDPDSLTLDDPQMMIINNNSNTSSRNNSARPSPSLNAQQKNEAKKLIPNQRALPQLQSLAANSNQNKVNQVRHHSYSSAVKSEMQQMLQSRALAQSTSQLTNSDMNNLKGLESIYNINKNNNNNNNNNNTNNTKFSNAFMDNDNSNVDNNNSSNIIDYMMSANNTDDISNSYHTLDIKNNSNNNDSTNPSTINVRNNSNGNFNNVEQDSMSQGDQQDMNDIMKFFINDGNANTNNNSGNTNVLGPMDILGKAEQYSNRSNNTNNNNNNGGSIINEIRQIPSETLNKINNGSSSNSTNNNILGNNIDISSTDLNQFLAMLNQTDNNNASGSNSNNNNTNDNDENNNNNHGNMSSTTTTNHNNTFDVHQSPFINDNSNNTEDALLGLLDQQDNIKDDSLLSVTMNLQQQQQSSNDMNLNNSGNSTSINNNDINDNDQQNNNNNNNNNNSNNNNQNMNFDFEMFMLQ